jgi:hypothetical protein
MSEYRSGTYCNDIGCRKHEEIASLPHEQYFEQKKRVCGDCAAWQFYRWLDSGEWKITSARAGSQHWTIEMPMPAILSGFESLNEDQVDRFRSLLER